MRTVRMTIVTIVGLGVGVPGVFVVLREAGLALHNLIGG